LHAAGAGPTTAARATWLGSSRAGPTPDQRKIRGRGVGQTFDICPLNLLGFFFTRPSSERPARLGYTLRLSWTGRARAMKIRSTKGRLVCLITPRRGIRHIGL